MSNALLHSLFSCKHWGTKYFTWIARVKIMAGQVTLPELVIVGQKNNNLFTVEADKYLIA